MHEREVRLVAGLVIAVLCALTVQALLVLNRKSRELGQSNRRLATSEETLRLAMENAPIGEALVGLDGRWLRVNGALCDLLGYSREALLDIDFQAITHPEDVDGDVAFLDKVLSGEIASYTLEKRYIHRDGHIIWGLLSVSLVRRRPFSLEYASPEGWSAGLFLKTNYAISCVWLAAFLISAVADAAITFLPALPIYPAVAVSLLALAGAITFTLRYPAFVQRPAPR